MGANKSPDLRPASTDFTSHSSEFVNMAPWYLPVAIPCKDKWKEKNVKKHKN